MAVLVERPEEVIMELLDLLRKRAGRGAENTRGRLSRRIAAPPDDLLRKNGHFAGGEGLQSARNTITLRYQNGKMSITDGPFVETKEQVGGILFLEAKDLNEAIQLLTNHPGAKFGPWEIRPIEDMTPAQKACEERRRVAAK